MFRGTKVGLLSVAILPVGLGFAFQGDAVVTPGPISYATQIAPLFAETCVSCHGTETQEAGLALHTYEAVMQGSEYGAVIEAGDPGASLLLDMISAGEMPQEADALSADQVAMVRSWIEAGAENN